MLSVLYSYLLNLWCVQRSRLLKEQMSILPSMSSSHMVTDLWLDVDSFLVFPYEAAITLLE